MGTHDLGNGCKAAMKPIAHKVKFLREEIASLWCTYEDLGSLMDPLIALSWERIVRDLGERLQRLED